MQTENNRLSILRKSRGYTQNDVAQIMGVKNSAVSKWECGRTLPDAEQLTALAKFYDVTVDYLLGVSGEQSLFDDARVPKSEVQSLFDRLTATDQGRALGYMQSMLDGYDR